jgi:hypothetical protein
MNESCDRLLQPCHNLSVPVAEPQIPFGANFEVTLALPNRTDGHFTRSYFRNPGDRRAKMPARFSTEAYVMIFDIVCIAILFQTIRVVSRLVGQRHGDVLDYVTRQ